MHEEHRASESSENVLARQVSDRAESAGGSFEEALGAAPMARRCVHSAGLDRPAGSLRGGARLNLRSRVA